MQYKIVSVLLVYFAVNVCNSQSFTSRQNPSFFNFQTRQSQYRPDNSGSYNQGAYNSGADNSGAYNPGSYNDGQYYGGDDGQYRPDDSGRYVHQDYKYQHFDVEGGQYHHKDEPYNPYADGQYKPDGSGGYVHDDQKYVHQDVGGGQYAHQPDSRDRYKPDNQAYRPDGTSGGLGSGGRNTGGIGSPFGAGGRQRPSLPGSTGGAFGAGGGNNVGGTGGRIGIGGTYRPNTGNVIGTGSNRGGSADTHAGLGPCSYDSLRNYRIIRQKGQVNEDSYHYLYETENCMYGEETGVLHNKGTKDEIIKAEGIFYYVGPDGIKYTVTYTADENGFLPQGEHIPKTPDYILRSLEWKKSIGEL